MSTALVPQGENQVSKPETAVEKLERRIDALKAKDLDVVTAVNRFADVPTELEVDDRENFKRLLATGTAEEIRAAGWKDKKQLRMAMYGTLPKRDWPAALQAAHERVMSRERRSEKKKGGGSFNLNMIVIPAPKPLTADDKIIEVHVEDDK